MTEDYIDKSPLGQKTDYIEMYDAELLFPIPRESKRFELNIPSKLPFHGMDIWNAYEISWLNPQGLPQVAYGVFTFPCNSKNIIESKSLKLYLNSFNQTKFRSLETVQETIRTDLSKTSDSVVKINLFSPSDWHTTPCHDFEGICLDNLESNTDTYQPEPDFLISNEPVVEETLFSHLLRSNCPVTGQPDWASVLFRYKGKQIDREGLLKYVISFRTFYEFHEQCVERMFVDIMKHCQPEKLTVYARYTRRGGLDINPFRSNFESPPKNIRSFRQ